MKIIQSTPTNTTSEYSVEFECFSKFLVMFDSAPNLTKAQILARAKNIADQTFGTEGTIFVERMTRNYSYVLTGLGIDARSGIVLNPAPERAQLKIIK